MLVKILARSSTSKNLSRKAENAAFAKLIEPVSAELELRPDGLEPNDESGISMEIMRGRLAGKNAVITGAGSGMGRAMAEMFAAEGAKVLCGDISGREVDVARALEGYHYAIRVDVTSSTEVERMITCAQEHFGKIDILINNAGMTGPTDLSVP